MIESKNKADGQYLNHCYDILNNGSRKENRTGVDTISKFGKFLEFDLNEGFPCLTSKKVFFKTSIAEMLWMMSGSTNINTMPSFARKTWSAWASENGEIGSAYGKQMRDFVSYFPTFNLLPKHLKEKISPDNFDINLNPEWESLIMVKNQTGNFSYYEYHVDQLKKIQWQLRTNPNDRRIILDLWSLADLEDMALMPCHFSSVFNVSEGNKLNCLLTIRSSDCALGLPFNIIMYSLLVNILAHCCNLKLGYLKIAIADAHIYTNHIEGISQQINAETYALPHLNFLNPEIKDFDKFTYKDFELVNYQHSELIKFDVAV